MSADHDDLHEMIVAAHHAPTRSAKVMYLGEARALLVRESERLRNAATLLDLYEAELAKGAT